MRSILLFCGYFILLQGVCRAQPFVLPKLAYGYGEYAPYIDAQTMEIHLTKHHQAYVNNLNKAVKGSPFEALSLEALLTSEKALQVEAIRNNAGGHYNHTLFWEILAPKAQQSILTEPLAQRIMATFGSMDSLKKELSKAAMSRFGSGWAWLILSPDSKLIVASTPNQDNPIMTLVSERGIPILGIDVWEHAYYLNYQNRRADYFNAVWELINWGVVSKKFQEAKENKLLIEKQPSTHKKRNR